ncbi:unnamed protein product [Polarella glacialis]|uniref:CSD domain-containing protein n=1 Tax=Polarella glacialis TaxID=89957 RepID=A0A813KMN7_POLGL|nr:unnamed protein product [Polarella glacialis]
MACCPSLGAGLLLRAARLRLSTHRSSCIWWSRLPQAQRKPWCPQQLPQAAAHTPSSRRGFTSEVESPRRMGTLKKWHDDRGFGFILEPDTGKDLFVHRSSLQTSMTPVEGLTVFYEVAWNDRHKQLNAVKVEGAEEQQGNTGTTGSQEIHEEHEWKETPQLPEDRSKLEFLQEQLESASDQQSAVGNALRSQLGSSSSSSLNLPGLTKEPLQVEALKVPSGASTEQRVELMMGQMEQLRLQGLQNQQLLLQGIYAMLQQQAVQNASLERTLLAVADRIGPASGGPPAADGMRLGWQGSIEAPLYNSSELGGGTLAEGTEGSGTQGETTQHRDPVAAPPAPEKSTSLKLEPSIKPHVEEEPVTKEQAVAAEERKEGQEREVEKKEEPHVEAKGQESKAQQQEVEANIGTSEETQDVGRPTSLSQPSGPPAADGMRLGWQGSIEAPLYNSSELGGGTLAEGTEGSGTQGETTQHRDPVAAPPAPEKSTSLKLEPSIKPHVEEEPVTKEQAVAAEERKEGQEREVEKKEEPHVEAKGQESKAQQQEVEANIGTSEETQDVGRPTSLSQPSGWKASRFHLIGFFNNWSLDSAATRECGERFEVRRNAQKAGNGGMLREEFQILGDKSWDKRVFPAGGSGEVVVLLKPGQPEPAEQSTEQVAGHGRNWAIDGRPGTSYRVTYEPLSRTVLCESM